LKTENCQQRVVEIEQSSDVWLYNLITKATVEMASPVDETPTYAADNVNGFMSSILAWVRDTNTVIGERNYAGFQLYDPEYLEDVTTTCKTALSQTIKCDVYLLNFMEPSIRGALYNETLMHSVCDLTCGESLRSWFDTVTLSCSGQNLTGAVPTKVGGFIYQGYNETCFKDPSTGRYCQGMLLCAWTVYILT
jgi:hypothetical protein